jgi:hypothetical protein
MAKRVSSGKRLRYEKQGNLKVSAKIFSNGRKMVRIVIDPDNMTFKLVDVVTGHVYDEGGNVTNEEVLLRKAKRHLKKLLDIYFEKEERNAGRFKK